MAVIAAQDQRQQENKQERKPLEQRAYSFEIRAAEEDGKGVITGTPIVYESRTDLGWFDEIIARGALDGADLTDVRFLVNHDTKGIPLARSRRNNGNSSMTLTVTERGMEIRTELDIENNSEACNLYSAIRRRDITGMSFLFGIADEEWQNLDSDHPTRIVRAISTVVEVSAVTFPAYKDTEISARSKDTLESARLAVETAQQQRAAQVDTGAETEMEKLKLQIKILGGMF
uniref:HK97 family phage prohead protease n=1 Tax=Eisenbergiella sp. TaxID=1924109 RepID=UPI003AB8A663